MNFRANRVLIVGGGICLVLLIVMSILYFQFNGKSSQASKNLDSAMGELRTYKSKNPFPSQENINKVRKNTEALLEFKENYTNELSSSQLLPLMSDPNEFIVYLEKVRKDISTGATSSNAEGKTVTTKLPEKFTFTFEDYLLQGKQPKDEAVPRLTVQLQFIQQILGLFFSNQVTEVVSLNRETFENKINNLNEEFDREEGVEESKGSVLGGTENHLYSTDKFEFNIKANEKVFWKTINELTNLELPVSIDQIEFKNGNTKLQPKLSSLNNPSTKTRTSRAPAPVRRTRRSTAGTETDTKKDLGTMYEKVVLAGHEDINVKLVLTLYKFPSINTESAN